jgi:hypothetical protein
MRAILMLWLLFGASAHAAPSNDVYYCLTEDVAGFGFNKINKSSKKGVSVQSVSP